MSKLLSKLLSILKIVLMFIAFGLVLIGLLLTNKRLEKSILDSLSTLIPFGLLIVMTIVNMFFKKSKMNENLLFNFTSCVLFATIIFIGYRAKFDTNMLLYYKYQIEYNPSYLSDNLSSIQIMIYCLLGSNVLFILKSLFGENNRTSYDETSTFDNKTLNYQYGVSHEPIRVKNSANIEEL